MYATSLEVKPKHNSTMIYEIKKKVGSEIVDKKSLWIKFQVSTRFNKQLCEHEILVVHVECLKTTNSQKDKCTKKYHSDINEQKLHWKLDEGQVKNSLDFISK